MIYFIFQDIEILSQSFERVVDRKDNVIKALAKDTEEAEEQYNVAVRNHVQNIDDLIGEVHIFLIDFNKVYNYIYLLPVYI